MFLFSLDLGVLSQAQGRYEVLLEHRRLSQWSRRWSWHPQLSCLPGHCCSPYTLALAAKSEDELEKVVLAPLFHGWYDGSNVIKINPSEQPIAKAILTHTHTHVGIGKAVMSRTLAAAPAPTSVAVTPTTTTNGNTARNIIDWLQGAKDIPPRYLELPSVKTLSVDSTWR